MRQVQGATHSFVRPTPVAAPRLLAWSDAMGEVLGIGRDEALPLLAGNTVPEGWQPYAMCYGGHQFGNWAGQLGDGRAINLGEFAGRDGGRWEVQLKGAGPTPYSRSADGRAVLRSSLREFLCSEAMHHLGVPTTRALSLVTTGEAVTRDMFYDGHPQDEPGAIVCRVAPSFLRMGHYELPAVRGDKALLRQLLDYTLQAHWAHGDSGIDPAAPDAAALWFADVVRRTAALMVHWMRVGFVHGVMNTDNLSVHGLTIDYGPYGWLEPYDAAWTPNTTDLPGRRYCFGNQPAVAQWNLSRLGSALATLDGDAAPFQQALDAYAGQYQDHFRAAFADKLGLREVDAVDGLLQALFDLMQRAEVDYTLFFRQFADVPVEAAADDDALIGPLRSAWYAPELLRGDLLAAWAAWLRRWAAVAMPDASARRARMQAANPLYVPRNYLAQLAIDAAEQGDAGPLARLQRVLETPYTAQDGCEDLAAKRPEWARQKPGCSTLSCSS